MHLGVVPMKPSLTGRWPHLADEEVGEARLERLAEEVGLLQDGVVRVEDLVQVVHVVRCSAQHTEGFSGSCTVEIEQAGSDYQTTPEGVASSFFATQLAPCHVNTADHVTRTLCSLCASASTLKGATLKWHLPSSSFHMAPQPGLFIAGAVVHAPPRCSACAPTWLHQGSGVGGPNSQMPSDPI